MMLHFGLNLILAAFLGLQVAAFPQMAGKMSSRDLQQLKDKIVANGQKRDLIGDLLQPLSGVLQGLDLPSPQPTGLQKIPADGDEEHKYIAPKAGDVRGLCPTLNTMANHGYISRDGITTFAEIANGAQTAYGFAYDLSVFLAALGLLAGGDPVTGKMSIGGQDSRVPNILGTSYGLDIHGPFEIDGSINRKDAYFGDDHSFNQKRWDRLVKLPKEYDNGMFSRNLFLKEKTLIYDESRATNPSFYAGAKYLVVAHAERAFIYRGLPNGTHPELADFQNIAPFYLNETFPKDWFRRAEPYTLLNTVEDVLDLYLNAPVELGQNQDLGNFVPLDMDIPNSLPELGCFLFSTLLDAGVGGVFAEGTKAIGEIVQNIIQPLFSQNFACNFTDFSSHAGSGSNRTMAKRTEVSA